MFKTNEKDEFGSYNGATVEDTVIGSSIKIEGDLVSNGSIVIEGEVVGSLKTEKSLKVGEKAKVVADVKAQTAYIAGKVQGNVTVSDKLELTSTAQVNGDISASTLVIAGGAVYNGKCAMNEGKVLNEQVQEKEE